MINKNSEFKYSTIMESQYREKLIYTLLLISFRATDYLNTLNASRAIVASLKDFSTPWGGVPPTLKTIVL